MRGSETDYALSNYPTRDEPRMKGDRHLGPEPGDGVLWRDRIAFYCAFPVHLSIQPSTSRYHCRELRGFSTQ